MPRGAGDPGGPPPRPSPAEPRRATHDPAELRRDVCALGFELIEDLDSEEVARRYFAGRRDGLGPYPQVHLARFRTI